MLLFFELINSIYIRVVFLLLIFFFLKYKKLFFKWFQAADNIIVDSSFFSWVF